MTLRRYAEISTALQSWVDVRAEQLAASRRGGSAQQGNRAAVTGAGHLNGVDQLIGRVVSEAYGGARMLLYSNPVMSGYYRATKKWDLLVTVDHEPALMVEYKSMSGSEGKNLNNRADEMFGVAQDARAAEEHGILPPDLLRAYVFIMGANDASLTPVGIGYPWGNPDQIFNGASYMDRMAIMLERMRDDGLYHLAWAVGVREYPFAWFEPRDAVNWERFETDLYAYVK